MPRTVVRLLAQPLAAAVVYTGLTVGAVGIGLVSTVAGALVLWLLLLPVAFVLVTRLLPIPRPDRSASLPWHFDDGNGTFRDVNDFLWRNEAKIAPAVIVPVVTIVPFLMLPSTTYAAGSVPFSVMLLFGIATWESWAVYRLSAQYLPHYSPHLFVGDGEPPITEDP